MDATYFLYRFLFIGATLYNSIFAFWLWKDATSLFALVPSKIPFSIVLVKPLAIGIAWFGLVYLYAAVYPHKAGWWIAFCLMAKIIPPFFVIGFILWLDWPPAMLKMIFFNDLIWWIPFALYLSSFHKMKQG